jgi:hypothetical protein
MTDRLLAGGGVLLRRITAWWSADGVASAAGRIIGTLLAVAAGGGVLLAAPALWWPFAAGWLLACWYAKPSTACECGEDPVDWLPALHAHLAGLFGKHLDVLAPALGITVEDLTAWCKAEGIDIRKVRVGARVRRGLRAQDLPPLPNPSPAPSDAGVAPGQTGNGNSNALAWIIPDPDGNPNRFAVHHAQTTHERERIPS